MFKSLLQALTKKPLSSKIVFQNCGDYAHGIPTGILTMNANGTELVRIRDDGTTPEWSPDGKWIAFSKWVFSSNPKDHCPNIHIMKPDGSEVRQITRHTTSGADSPSWSCDSRTIAYNATENGESQIWTVDVFSGQQRQLAEVGISPVWTLANEIVFEKNAGSHPLMIMDSNGKQLRECRLFEDGDWSIRWSRDGDKITFLRNREIYVMNSDGSNLQKIRAGAVATGLSWSPDGRQLVYYGEHSNQSVETGKEIYVIDSNGANEKKIVANPWLYENPKDKLAAPLAELVNVSWSPWLH